MSSQCPYQQAFAALRPIAQWRVALILPPSWPDCGNPIRRSRAWEGRMVSSGWLLAPWVVRSRSITNLHTGLKRDGTAQLAVSEENQFHSAGNTQFADKLLQYIIELGLRQV